MGRRQSWRAGAGCKPVASRLSEFESHPPHQGVSLNAIREWVETPGRKIEEESRIC